MMKNKIPLRFGPNVELLLTFLFIWNSVVKKSEPAKILVIHPLQGGSHRIQLRTLGETLMGKGHSVTTVSFLNVGDNPRNAELKTSEHHFLSEQEFENKSMRVSQTHVYVLVGSDLLWRKGHNPHSLPLGAFKMTEALCRTLFQDSVLKNKLRDEKFDLAIVDLISNECGLAYIYNLGISSVVGYWAMFPVSGEMDYIPSSIPPSYVPAFLSKLPEEMTYLERVYNFYLRIGSYIVMQIQFYLAHKYIQEYFPRTPHPKDLIANLSGILINSDYSLDYPKLLPPNAVNVGCMQCRDPAPLPKELETFMESSGQFGVVVFSMGGLFDAAVANTLLPKLFRAFSRLQQKVIMKAGLTHNQKFNVPENVKIVDWLHQQDVLGHRKTKVFFSHCGLHGIMEAMWHSVPIVGMPIYGDQFDVLVRIQEKGIGIGLEDKDVSENTIYEALHNVLTNSSFSRNSRKIQRLLKDQREHPMSRAVWFLEYIVRHDGAHHLKSGSRFLPWYQLHCLDVLLGIIVAAFLVLFLSWKISVWLLYLCLKLFRTSLVFTLDSFLKSRVNFKLLKSKTSLKENKSK